MRGKGADVNDARAHIRPVARCGAATVSMLFVASMLTGCQGTPPPPLYDDDTVAQVTVTMVDAVDDTFAAFGTTEGWTDRSGHDPIDSSGARSAEFETEGCYGTTWMGLREDGPAGFRYAIELDGGARTITDDLLARLTSAWSDRGLTSISGPEIGADQRTHLIATGPEQPSATIDLSYYPDSPTQPVLLEAHGVCAHP
ncbi:hypothetical protein [Herbiconiux liangxiaofengii]|uniref:hypothetical protein n=1 Tax=Herbiconiux liangxiaofengii TaxID=3342795 RepID=UPI003CEF235B